MVGQHNSRARLRSLCGQLRFTAAEATILCFPPSRHRRRTTPVQRAITWGHTGLVSSVGPVGGTD